MPPGDVKAMSTAARRDGNKFEEGKAGRQSSGAGPSLDHNKCNTSPQVG